MRATDTQVHSHREHGRTASRSVQKFVSFFPFRIFPGPRRLSFVARASHSSRSRSRVEALGTLGSGLHGVSREAGRGIRSKVRAMPYDPRPLTLSIPPTRLRPARILSVSLCLSPSFSSLLLHSPPTTASRFLLLVPAAPFLSFPLSLSRLLSLLFPLSNVSRRGSRTMRVIHVCKARI